MSRYPAQPLEEKLAWLRERIKQKAQAEPKPAQRAISLTRHRRQERRLAEAPSSLRMYRVPLVAELLGVSADTVRKWFQDRAVIAGETQTTKSRRRKRTFLISERDLMEWVEEHYGRS